MKLQVDETLLNATINGTTDGLAMTGVTPPPVGATRFFTANRPIAVIVGLVGACSGTLTLNLTERGMTHLAGRLMGEETSEVTEDTFDAIMEIGNMIAGRVKECLMGTEYELQGISVPSLILGANYNVYYTRGIHVVSVEFELEDISAVYQKDRFFSSTISLLRRSN